MKILIVDDEPPVRRLLGRIVETLGYACVLAGDAAEARDCLQGTNFELVLCDINMPGESGLDFVREILATRQDTAAIMVTGIDDPAVGETALEIGAYDYVTKPIERNRVLLSVAGALRRRELEIAHRTYRESLEQKVAERTTSLENSLARLRQAMDGIIQALALTVETRDPYTAGHQRRVTNLACAIAREMGLPEDRVQGLGMAGIIHDLGKIAVPAEILSKPSRLTASELSLIKEHPQVGYEILKDIEFPWPVAEIVREHHERLDGSGYPQGLAGENILLEARVLAVADVVEAIASHRPYRPALGLETSLEEISSKRGQAYDPQVVDACVKLIREKGFQIE